MNSSPIRYGIYRALLGLALGILLLIDPQNSLNVLVRLIAIIFLFSGLFSLYFSWKSGREAERDRRHDRADRGLQRLLLLNSFVNVIFAVVLFIFPAFFASLIWVLVGLILALASVMQFMALVQFRRSVANALPWYLYAAPVLVFVLSIVILSNPFETALTLTVFAGIICLLYAVLEIIQAICEGRLRKKYTSYTEVTPENPGQ